MASFSCLPAGMAQKGKEAMIQKQLSTIPQILRQQREAMLTEWTRQQLGSRSLPHGLQDEREIRTESERFLNLLTNAVSAQNGREVGGIEGDQWSEVRGMLEDLSRTRAIRGYTPSETATFIFSLKQPLFNRIREELRG